MEEPVPGGVRVADPFQLRERIRRRVGDEGQWRVQLIELIVTRVGLAEDSRPALPGVANDTKYCSRCRWIVQDGRCAAWDRSYALVALRQVVLTTAKIGEYFG
jgi:hypothetical protein